MAAPRDASKHFVKMKLGAPRVRVLLILPVDDEDAQRLEHALLARVRVKHSVDEASALFASVAFCETN